MGSSTSRRFAMAFVAVVCSMLLALPATASARARWTVDKAERTVSRDYHGENYVICNGRGASRTRSSGTRVYARFACIVDWDDSYLVVVLRVLSKYRYSIFEIT